MQIILSNTIKNAGNIVITTTMLIRAPLEINVQIEPIISIFDIIETPHVAAKKHDALTIIDFAEFSSAYFAALVYRFSIER